MKFSVGDKVILNENGADAEVTGILSTKVIEVLSFGMEFPVRITDVHFPNSKPFAPIVPAERAIAKPKRSIVPELISGFYLSFQPTFVDAMKEEINAFEIAFLNQSKMPVMFEFYCRFQQSNVTEVQKSIIAPFDKRQLLQLPMVDMNGKPRFYYKIYPVAEEVRRAESSWFHVADTLLLQPRKLFKHLSEMQTKEGDSFEILLAEASSNQTSALPEFKSVSSRKSDREESGRPKGSTKQRKGRKLDAIDLHAESLGISIQKLSNFEILSRQMQALENAIDRAVMQRQTSLVVIHGVGTGKLKEEVHLLLNGHPSVAFFQHNWRPKHGWGATEAFLK